MTAAPSPRPRRGHPWIAFFSPLWFAWRGRYLEVLLCFAAYSAMSWVAVMRSYGWVRSDALRLGAMALVTPFLSIGLPTPVLGEPTAPLPELVLAVLQAAWAWTIARRPARVPLRLRAAGVATLVALAAVGFTGIRVPGTKPRAYLGAMRESLRDLAVAQESSHARRRTYAAALDSLALRTAPGVTLTILAAGDSGWSASASHAAMQATCSLTVARGAAVAAEPECRLPERTVPWSR